MTLSGGLPLTSHISLELIELIGSWSVPLCAALALVCAAAGFTAFRSAKPASFRAAVSIAAAAAAAMAAGYPLAAWTGGVDLCVCRSSDAARSGHGRVVLPVVPRILAHGGAPRRGVGACLGGHKLGAFAGDVRACGRGPRSGVFRGRGFIGAFAGVRLARRPRILRGRFVRRPPPAAWRRRVFVLAKPARGGARAASVRLRHRIRRGHHAHDVAYGGARHGRSRQHARRAGGGDRGGRAALVRPEKGAEG